MSAQNIKVINKKLEELAHDMFDGPPPSRSSVRKKVSIRSWWLHALRLSENTNKQNNIEEE